MIKKNRWSVITSGEKAKCFYCLKPTLSSLEFKDGSEVWSCEECALLHGKIRRLKKRYKKKKKFDSKKILHVKKSENELIQRGLIL